MGTDKRLYLVPVREACNASCSFCYMKEKEKDFSKPQYIVPNELENSLLPIRGHFHEVEITGGGDPMLHKNLNEIVGFFKEEYVKMYTNGFLLKPISGINEINISRVHWNSEINNRFYNSSSQNDIGEAIDFYRGRVDKVRIQTILLKGAIDNEKKALDFILRYEEKVDEFMFRVLFPKCSLEKDLFVDYFPIHHKKVKIDRTLDNYNRELFFIGTDSIVHGDFQF